MSWQKTTTKPEGLIWGALNGLCSLNKKSPKPSMEWGEGMTMKKGKTGSLNTTFFK
ncbi:hypothetical protein [Vibrio algicola]|uniref:Uncharacterized protein n=1 Tax=Vibrio algicola TaxID=2662262 RepID=A0A5Q0TI82_9VIBR|nr:hypothetical protein [Vibrio algicola]